PVLPIVTIKSLDEALEHIKDGEKPLAAYIFTNDGNKVSRLITETSSGGVTVNDVILHMTVDTLPFGGVGNSGMGRYRGKYGFDTFSHEKAILKRGFMGESLMAVRYPPFTTKKFEQLKKLTGGRKGFPKFFRHIGVLPILILGVFVGIFIQRFLLRHA
uniref:Aldehyde dehydrogenase domain-containing protein n=1 Tax=Plectus sambesii TaxID=2011161 RepID=A0A914X841_9BILA